jgi:hypothetical protein
MIEEIAGVDLFISLAAVIGFLFGLIQIYKLKQV